MQCVDGHADLIGLSFEEVRLDLCPECKGVWFDAGELERCAEKPARKVLATFGDVVARMNSEGLKGPPRSCPRCARAMEKERFLQGVWIDRCPDNHGIWLDGGEMATVQALLRHAQDPTDTSGAGNPLLEFVKIQIAVLFRPLLK